VTSLDIVEAFTATYPAGHVIVLALAKFVPSFPHFVRTDYPTIAVDPSF